MDDHLYNALDEDLYKVIDKKTNDTQKLTLMQIQVGRHLMQLEQAVLALGTKEILTVVKL